METIMDGIVIVLTPAPIIDPFRAWKSKSPLCHKDTAKFKKCPKYLLDFKCLELCLYGIKELATATP